MEFYELVASRLAPGGLFVQWVPTGRVLNSVRGCSATSPLGEVPDYFASRFLVASDEPLKLDGDTLRHRFAAMDLSRRSAPNRSSASTPSSSRSTSSASPTSGSRT